MTIEPSTQTPRPLVLMDIDGVLNAFGATSLEPHHRIAHAGGYRLTLDERHPGWLDRIAEVAELTWASMWQADAAALFGVAAGIGTDWPFLDFDAEWRRIGRQSVSARTGIGVGGHKWPMIVKSGTSCRPLVWIDDDMTDDQLVWAENRHASGPPTLFIRPDPAMGFTADQFEEILAFCERRGVGVRG